VPALFRDPASFAVASDPIAGAPSPVGVTAEATSSRLTSSGKTTFFTKFGLLTKARPSAGWIPIAVR
jgi:hypothetical protein